jgi:hypothetical protein
MWSAALFRLFGFFLSQAAVQAAKEKNKREKQKKAAEKRRTP